MELLNLSGEVIHKKKGATTIKQVVLAALHAGKPLYMANLTGADLTRADLIGADLAKADLTGAKFTGANLTWAGLVGADFTGADFTGANLTRANFTGANLTRADLIGADFIGAKLIGANLTRANLTRANFTRADLTGANLDYSCFPLWYGSLNMKIDERIGKQLMYHVLSLVKDLPECKSMITQEMLAYANGYHRVKEGQLPPAKA